MKTLPLLVCICVLSACFSLSEAQKKQRKTQKKNTLQPYKVNHGSRSHPKLPPYWNPLIKRPLPFDQQRRHKTLNSKRRIPTRPKPLRPPNCPVKNNTVVSNNTSEATTQSPPVTPTSTSINTSILPGVPSPAQNATTTPSRENNDTTGSSAAAPEPQPSPVPPGSTAAPPTYSPDAPEPQPSTAPPGSTAAPPTSSPDDPEPQPSTAPPGATAVLSTSSPAVAEPQPSTAPPGTTAAPNAALNLSTTQIPETSKSTAVPTTQTPVATTQITTVEEPDISSIEKAFYKFFLTASELLGEIWDVLRKH